MEVLDSHIAFKKMHDFMLMYLRILKVTVFSVPDTFFFKLLVKCYFDRSSKDGRNY
jgi:hypothetical protein